MDATILTALAEATGGRYYGARDGEALARALTRAALSRIPYTVFDEKGTRVASGFAGPLAEALAPGTYRVVVEVPDQELTERVTVIAGTDVIVKVAERGDRFELRTETRPAL